MRQRFVTRRAAFNVLVGTLVACAAGGGSVRGEMAVLNPKEYASPSGAYRLRVDPGNRYGAGKATYGLTRQGKEIWSGERPFTLWEAGVTDDGTVAGYAYSRGLEAIGDAGDMRVIILDPRGTVRAEHVARRGEGARTLHAPPNPMAEGLILDSANDRLVVHVYGAAADRWRELLWVYRLSTGMAEGRVDPKERMRDPDRVSHMIDARAVAGTPLILLHWWRSNPSEPDGDVGARFTLIDLKGETVWTLDLPNDYTRRDNEEAEGRLREEIRRAGAVLPTDRSGHFDLRFAAENQRVTFAVERRPNGQWTVREIARQKYAIASKSRLSEIPEKPLPYLGAIGLRAPGQKPAADVRDIREFVIDGTGRLAFLRGEPDGGAPSFVLVDQTGTVVRVARLNQLDGKRDADYFTHLTWCGGDRFLVAWSHWGVGAKASACWIDGTAARTTALEGFDCPAVERLAGFTDGGFAALAKDRAKNTWTASVCLFDARGRLVRRIPQDYGREPGTLFSPGDVAVTTEGKVAVLDVIRHSISVFDGRGAYLRTIDLEAAWKRKPNYPSHLAADSDGGLIVGDFNGRPPIVRMRADGEVREELTAKYADGRTDATMQRVRAAPDGSVWTSDGSALLRLDANGVVDKVIGEPPNPDQLGGIASLTVDRRGRIYAVDPRSAAIHVFDSAGKHLRIYRSQPTDFGGKLGLPDVTVAESGDVYLGGSLDRQGEYLRFSPEGKRVGFERLGLDTIHEEWRFRPGGMARWVLGHETIFLVDSRGAVQRTIERRPDGHWLDGLHNGVVAPNGSLAVTTGAGWGRRDVTLSVYDRMGNPLRTIPLPMVESPFAPFGYDGECVAVADGKRTLMFDKTGRPIQQFRPPATGQREPYWRPFLIAGERQLWLFDSQHAIHRYALP
jgi:sugar lactone lactonase YvrE